MTIQPAASQFRRRFRLFRRPSLTPHPAMPRPERRDCQGRLVAQLLMALGEGWTLADASFRPWCSATFLGAQHCIKLRCESADAIDLARAASERLPVQEFRVPGHVVADLAIDAIREIAPGIADLDLALLTVEDW